MSRWALVELEPDLAACRTTQTGVFAGIKCVNGVRQVTDCSALSQRTIHDWVGEVLVPDTDTLVPRKRRSRRNGAT